MKDYKKTMYESITKKDSMKFNNLASYVVDNYITDMHGKPLTGGDRDSVILATAYNIALGAKTVNIDRYLIIGSAIGIVTYVTIDKIRNSWYYKNKNKS